MKQRITITLDEDLLQKIDEKIDGTTIKNRSHAIEMNLSKVLKRNVIRDAVVLAGGPYTVVDNHKETPTLLLDIHGSPVLEHTIIELKKNGVDNIILAVGSFAKEIKKYFGDGSRLGIHITYIEDEKEPLGTAGILRKAMPHLSGPCIVTNGDVLKEINIRDMYEFHKKQGTLATIALTSHNQPTKYGVAILNGNQVHSFIEKPQENIPTNLINAGLYIFEPGVLNEIPEGFAKLEVDVFPKLAQKEEIAGYVFYGKWNYVRSPELIRQAREEW